MTPFIEQIIVAGNANRILTSKQLARVIAGSEDNRYRQVNRALRQGELIKVRRNSYVLTDKLRDYPVNSFAMAQHLRPGSYISAETALSHHGWIPEAVHTVFSIINKGNSSSHTYEGFGHFEFARLKVRKGHFLQSVGRYKNQQQISLIADPVRALIDLMALRKQEWQGMGFLIDGMRVDKDALMRAPSNKIYSLLDVYKGKREQHFIQSLLKELGLG